MAKQVGYNNPTQVPIITPKPPIICNYWQKGPYYNPHLITLLSTGSNEFATKPERITLAIKLLLFLSSHCQPEPAEMH